MAPKLYKKDLSPPVRSVYLTAAALGLTLEYCEVDYLSEKHLTPEYLKINPQHTVPALEDDGKIICDSHAINAYLVNKYGKDDSLYPKDPYQRAIVDQRLHFDSGVLFPTAKKIVRLFFIHGAKSIPQEQVEETIQAYEFLERFLEGHSWAAGDQVTLADFSLATTATASDVLIPIDSNKYPNIISWIKKVQGLPYYHVAEKGDEEFKNFMAPYLS